MNEFPLLVPSAVVFLAFYIRSLTGFGAGLICIPLLTLYFELPFVVPMEKFFELGLSVLLIPKIYRDIDWRQLYPTAIGMFGGIAFGAHLLANTPVDNLKICLSVVVFSFSVYMVKTAETPLVLGISSKWGLLVGFFAGIFSGLFGMSAPLLVPYFVYQLSGKNAFRATLIALYFFSSIWSVAVFSFNGLYTQATLWVVLSLTPAFFIGTVLGHLSHTKLTDAIFRKIIALVLFSSGILLLQ